MEVLLYKARSTCMYKFMRINHFVLCRKRAAATGWNSGSWYVLHYNYDACIGGLCPNSMSCMRLR